jgi:ribosome recycling factor
MTSIQQVLKDTRTSMEKGIENTKREFSSIRSGKASPNMLDTVRLEIYGTQMTLNQVATVSTPEPRVILVTPFDKSLRRRFENQISGWSLPRKDRSSAFLCRR